jgi:hypothetical protein
MLGLFCKHKWTTLERRYSKVYEEGDNADTALPIRIYAIGRQQCEKCGKEVMRKYRI